MGRSALSWAGLLAALFVSGSCPPTAAAASVASKWRTVCSLSGDDLSFGQVTIEGVGGPRQADRVHADHATVLLEVDGAQARVRAHITAPFDFVVTTKNFAEASLSLRGGARAGVVTAEGDGIVVVEAVTGNGHAMSLGAGGLTVGGLPLRCEDLVATRPERHWMLGATSHKATGLSRIFSAPGGGSGFPVDSGGPIYLSAADRTRGDWRQIEYGGQVGVKGFLVSGWVSGVRFSKGGSEGGGGLGDPGFRPCASGTPSRMGFATLRAGSALFDSSSGGKAWATLTAPVRALVALYPRDRAAVAGLTGWQWSRSSCEMGWVDPDGLVLETSLTAPAAAAE